MYEPPKSSSAACQHKDASSTRAMIRHGNLFRDTTQARAKCNHSLQQQTVVGGRMDGCFVVWVVAESGTRLFIGLV